ncbi:DUF6731 family protein [Methylotenera sp. G11]|uniref:DUF6731 family protein n=1 Tax=Methylotenera sp. G11 TaxID=1506585 RepID=UPI000646B720|nr:DUF6731 family protein [Methylotenera sp. G11]
MATKKFKVGFFVGCVGAGGRDGRVSQTLLDLSQQLQCQSIVSGDVSYQIRELIPFNNGASFRGVFAKIRTTDIPHIGSTGGEEREIDLDDDEGVIEKNHFLYYRQNELLVYQSNGNGSTVEAFGRYFSDILNHTTVFNAILKADAMRRMMSADLEPRTIELSVARPTNPDLYPNDDWSSELFGLMAGIDGFKARIKISAEGAGRSRGRLMDRAKRVAAALVNSGNANIARIKMAGVEQPIDLIADRVIAQVSVEMNGRYPVSDEMFRALGEAKNQLAEDLDAVLGGQNALD